MCLKWNKHEEAALADKGPKGNTFPRGYNEMLRRWNTTRPQINFWFGKGTEGKKKQCRGQNSVFGYLVCGGSPVPPCPVNMEKKPWQSLALMSLDFHQPSPARLIYNHYVFSVGVQTAIAMIHLKSPETLNKCVWWQQRLPYSLIPLLWDSGTWF